MTNIMIAGVIGFLVTLFGTPLVIKRFRRAGWGQLIREEGPKAHYEKHGTPTMGGIIIMIGCILGYLIGHLGTGGFSPLTDSGLLGLGMIVAMGMLGFVDDYIKVRNNRNLGLQKRAKFIGQTVISFVFTFIAVEIVNIGTDLSFFRSTALDLGPFFYIVTFLMITATSNAVNLTDGLDGLAVGSGAQVLGAFVVIGFWQFRHPLFYDLVASGSDPFDLAILASGLFGACGGFLWWNTPPARIFMGDTGSLMLGGAMAAFAILLNTQVLLVLLGGLYVIETLSVIFQVAVFRRTRKRLFLMAPIHHHFELAGWAEQTVIVRFWVISGLSVAFALGLFYADFISKGGA